MIRLHDGTLTTKALTTWMIAAVWMLGCGGADTGTPTSIEPSATAREDAASEPADLHTLVGRWRRPDGGYVLEIRSVADNGSVDAAYFNPKPINVSLAQASEWQGTPALFVELDDVNYRGSTYELAHDPDRDLLVGTYYQAALGQTFEVAFVRIQ